MNLPDDLSDLERELARCQQPKPSPDFRPRVLSAVAHELSLPSTSVMLSRRSRLGPFTICVSLAASIVLVFAIWQFSKPLRPPVLPDSYPRIAQLPPDDRLTTWRACRQALAQSPDALDQLLQRNAAQSHSSPPQTLPHTHTNLLAQIGDLK